MQLIYNYYNFVMSNCQYGCFTLSAASFRVVFARLLSLSEKYTDFVFCCIRLISATMKRHARSCRISFSLTVYRTMVRRCHCLLACVHACVYVRTCMRGCVGTCARARARVRTCVVRAGVRARACVCGRRSLVSDARRRPPPTTSCDGQQAPVPASWSSPRHAISGTAPGPAAVHRRH